MSGILDLYAYVVDVRGGKGWPGQGVPIEED